MSDPVYAVGSLYFAGQVYPDKSIVEDCLANLNDDLAKFKKMLVGEKVSQYNNHYGKMIDDQRKFAGYTDDELITNIAELEEIVSELSQFMQKDYK
jgi:hypothetical protein